MSKIIALALLATLTLIPQPGITKTSATSTPPADEMEVTVLFSGLMVFNQISPPYVSEVGILSRADSHGHEFCVQRQGGRAVCRDDLPTGKKWTLEVIETGQPPLNAVANNARRPDNEAAQYDFDWIIPLDGPGFHDGYLELKPNHLTPIIKLPKVQLFTRYKSHDLLKWKRRKSRRLITPSQTPIPMDATPFGFAAETIGLRVNLKPREQLILRDDQTGKPIVTIRYRPPSPIGGHYEVLSISNVRTTPHPGSDFGMYYRLFPYATEHYYLYRNPDSTYTAYNELPRYDDAVRQYTYGYKNYQTKSTCCGLWCTQVLLTNWKKPLH
jgi:hypothetical protein